MRGRLPSVSYMMVSTAQTICRRPVEHPVCSVLQRAAQCGPTKAVVAQNYKNEGTHAKIVLQSPRAQNSMHALCVVCKVCRWEMSGMDGKNRIRLQHCTHFTNRVWLIMWFPKPIEVL